MNVFRSSNSDVYTIATFYPYETNRIYTRRWNVGGNAWKPWEMFSPTKVLTTIQRQAISTALLIQGEQCFDTTLSKPLWIKSNYPTVWVDSTGTIIA